MSHKLTLWILGLLIIIIALSGRILRVEGAPMPDGAQTSVASTLQAIFTPQTTATVPPSLLPVTGWVIPTSLPTNTAIPTISIPMLTLREATNCRTGPGQGYEIIVTYQIDQVLEIAGRYEAENFWLVKSVESPTGTCWLWGEFADTVGSYYTVSAVTPPPTATLSLPPQAPSLQKWTFACSSMDNTLSMTILWEDNATNEAGYRIFRDGLPVAELSAGSTAYTETITMPVSQSAEYYVQAHNAAGLSPMKVIKLNSSAIQQACYQ